MRVFIIWSFCLWAVVRPDFAQAQWSCSGLLRRNGTSSLNKAYLEQAYEVFLHSLKERKTSSPLPDSIRFSGRDYRVTAFLGEGVQGLVFKVEDERGKKSIIKLFKDTIAFPLSTIPFSIGALHYFHMNFKTRTRYSPIGFDFKLSALRFPDMRAIPIDKIDRILEGLNAPEPLRAEVAKKIEQGYRLSYRYANHVFDIDKFAVVVIDPF